MSRSAAPTTHGTPASYGPMLDARDLVWWRHCWLACLGVVKQHMSKIERELWLGLQWPILWEVGGQWHWCCQAIWMLKFKNGSLERGDILKSTSGRNWHATLQTCLLAWKMKFQNFQHLGECLSGCDPQPAVQTKYTINYAATTDQDHTVSFTMEHCPHDTRFFSISHLVDIDSMYTDMARTFLFIILKIKMTSELFELVV